MAPRKRQKTNHKHANGNDHEEQDDRISSISTCILITIISLLPIKDAGRTAILSKKFRDLWAWAPLNIDDAEFCTRRSKNCRRSSCAAKCVWAITRILYAHKGPIRRFCLSHANYQMIAPFLKDWFIIVAEKRVKELELNFLSCVEWELPNDLLHCKSIETLTLQNITFPSTAFVSPVITGITEMNLSKIYMEEEDVALMFSSCRSLRSLTLFQPVINSDGITKVHIRSESLVSLTVLYTTYVNEIFILDAPKLERFLVKPDIPTRVSINISNAPNLRICGYLRMPTRLFAFGDIYMMGFQVMIGTVRSLRTLAISVRFDHPLEAIAALQLLRCFPNLETLYIQSLYSEIGAAFAFYPDKDEPIECLNHTLKTVIFNEYQGCVGEQDFARFLISRGRVLQEMRFTGSCTKIAWTCRMEKRLLFDQRSDVNLRYRRTTKVQEFISKTDASNWSIVDPFDTRK